MEHVSGELVRIRTGDNLELHGILFEPKRKTSKALVHVHGWNGNFYENNFIDSIAREALRRGFAFLTFNNRGVGFISDLVRRKNSKASYVKIGGSIEIFEECVIDIKAAMDFMSKRGYSKTILQGHSTGCQKITYYQFKTKDRRVKGLIELAPVDDANLVKRLLGKKYKKSLEIAKKMVKKGAGNLPVPAWMSLGNRYGKTIFLSAERYLNMSDPEAPKGRIFNYSGKLEEIKDADRPVLVIFGSRDEYEFKPQDKLKILEKNVENCVIKLIKNSNHGFVGHEAKLSRLIGNWLKSTGS